MAAVTPPGAAAFPGGTFPGTTFPGATGVSGIEVYDWPAEDGRAGGSPHVHVLSTECYVVVSGHGTLETLDRDGYRETALAPGVVVWFTPGTVHRAVNGSGDLTLLIVMQNGGLPEHGDAVLTLPPDRLRDRASYRAAAALAPADADADDPGAEAAARARRDLAVSGYLELRSAVLEEGAAALAPFFTAAVGIVAASTAAWSDAVEQGTGHQADQLRSRLRELGERRADLLLEGTTRLATPAPHRTYGMCGRISSWQTV